MPTELEIGMAVAMAFVAALLLRAIDPKPDEQFGKVFFALLGFFAIGFAGRLFGIGF
jgi:hypothetical protein